MFLHPQYSGQKPHGVHRGLRPLSHRPQLRAEDLTTPARRPDGPRRALAMGRGPRALAAVCVRRTHFEDTMPKRPGKPQTPAALSIVQGERGKRKKLTAIPSGEPIVGDVPPPPWLSPEAQEAWLVVVPWLQSWNGFQAQDAMGVSMLCQTYAFMLEAAHDVQDNGATYESDGRNGLQIKQNPSVGIFESMVRLYSAIGSDYGVSPAARNKLAGMAQLELFGVAPGDELDELDQMYG